MLFKVQRDEVATVLRELLRLYDWRHKLGRIELDPQHDQKQMKKWLNQYGREKNVAWIEARRVLEGCPSHEQQLRNLFGSLGLDYDSSVYAAPPGESSDKET